MASAVTTQTASPRTGTRSGPRSDMNRVLRALDEYCASLQPGDVIPVLAELMRRFDASERAVRSALDELRRQGKIIRRQGAGTFIAERPPQPHATALAVPAPLTDSTTIVAVGKPDRSFFDRCMHLLVEQTESVGLSLACRMLSSESDTLPVLSADAAQTKGFILFSYRLAPLAKALQDAGSRVVLLGEVPMDVMPEVPCVHGDSEQGGYLNTHHLLELGHRRIAFVGIEGPERIPRWRGRERAVQEARRKREVHVTYIQHAEIAAWAKDPALAAAYFAREDAPTGVVEWNDHDAARLLSVLTRAGVKVPEQVSLVGYDNLPEGELVYPPLTTVDHGIDQQLQAALSLLTRPTPPPPSHTIVTLPTLICRESSAPPKAAEKELPIRKKAP